MTDGQDQALKTKDILGLTLQIKLFMFWGYDGIIYKGTVPKDYKNQYIPIYKVSTLKNLLNGKYKLKR